jgi:hypothetical protein
VEWVVGTQDQILFWEMAVMTKVVEEEEEEEEEELEDSWERYKTWSLPAVHPNRNLPVEE